MTLIQKLDDLLKRVTRIEKDLGYHQPKKNTVPALPDPPKGGSGVQRKSPGRKAFGNRRWTDAEDDALIVMKKSGRDGRTMARELGRSLKAIHSRVWVLNKRGRLK